MTIDEIKHLAELSKLNFSDAELEKFLKDFDEISVFFKQLDNVDDNVEVEKEFVRNFEQLREDIIAPSQERELILKNAPKKDSISFIVPKVVE